MARIAAVFVVMTVATLFGCTSSPHASEKVAARAWNFPIEGQLASISVSDLAAIVRAMESTRIYRLRIINRNRVEADTTNGWVTVGYWSHGRHFYRRSYSEDSPAYTVLERIHGVWQTGERVFITY